MEIIVSIIVTALRLLIPFSILRWPLGGIILAILADAFDVIIFEKFGGGLFYNADYHKADKFLDVYYLFFAFLAVHSWTDTLARRTAKTLFLWRFIGFGIFEFTGLRPILLAAPNIFENFFIFWMVILRFFPSFKLTPLRLAVAVFILGFPKVIQEYVMHFKYPDQTWHFIKNNFFWWFYK